MGSEEGHRLTFFNKVSVDFYTKLSVWDNCSYLERDTELLPVPIFDVKNYFTGWKSYDDLSVPEFFTHHFYNDGVHIKPSCHVNFWLGFHCSLR